MVSLFPGVAFAAHRSFSEAKNWTPEGPYWGQWGNAFADVTGDGKADAIVVSADGITVRVSNGNGFLSKTNWTKGPFYSTTWGTFFADVTGPDADGKRRADAITVNDGRILVRRSNGSNFSSGKKPEDWGPGESFATSDWIMNPSFEDVTGDGKADVVIVHDDRITVRRSTGNTFGGDEDWTWGEPFYGTRATAFADVTGDGRADAIAVNDDRILVKQSYYSSLFGKDTFASVEDWTAGPYPAMYGEYGTFFADTTGDGKADAIAVNWDGVAIRDAFSAGGQMQFRSPDPANNNYVVSGDGPCCGPWGYWTNGGFYGTYGTFFADVTGDGTADVIADSYNGVWVGRSCHKNIGTECWGQ